MALVGKDQLVHEVAETSGLGVADARRVLDETFRAIETQLGEGNEVRLTGFGKFSVSRRKAREGRNPQTGEPMRIAAKKVPHFSAGAELKKAVPPAPHDGASKSRSKAAVKTRKAQTSGPQKSQSSAKKRRPTTHRSKRQVAPEKAGSESGGKDPMETTAAGKAVSVAASGAKYAVVAAAGLAAGVAGGLAVVRRR